MKRIINFRGKDIKTGKWVYGLPQQRVEHHGVVNLDKPAEIGYIVSYEPHRMLESGVDDSCLFWHEVDPETIGEWTGLKDKNDVEIYEDDILEIEGATAKVVFWKRPPEFGLDYYHNEDAWCEDWNITDDSERMEVIGNIHDNPKLLPVTKDQN